MTVSTRAYQAQLPDGTTVRVAGGELSLDAGRAPHVTGSLELPLPGRWTTTPDKLGPWRELPGALNIDRATLAPARSVEGDRVTVYRYRWTGAADDDTAVLEAADVLEHGGPVWTPAPAVLELLDPRRSPAPRVVVTADSDGTLRRFDLTVRDRHVNVTAGTVTVELASDEALLNDYAPIADDDGPFTHQGSLRNVVEYALRKALGATLELAPALDADVTRYSSSVNQCTNPAAAVNLEGWGAAGVVSLTQQTSAAWTANTHKTALRLYGNTTTDNTYIQTLWAGGGLTGKRLLFRARCRNGSGLTAPGVNASRMRAYYSVNGGASFTEIGTAGGNTGSNAQADLAVTGEVPSHATHVLLRLYHGYKSADSVFWTDIQAREYDGDPTDTDYWDGSTPSSSAYRYAWQGAAGASPSSREAVLDRPTDALLWQAGTSALEFLQPLVQAHGFRLVCDELRRWTLRNETYQAGGELRLREGVNIVSADETVSRDAGSWFDARVTRYRWRDVQGQQRQRIDAYALPGYTRLELVDIDAPYPGPGRSEYAVRRAQTAGSEVSAQAVADWTAQAEQRTSLSLSHSPAALVGTTTSVQFNLDDDRMTITTRVRELTAGAVDTLTGTINQLTGTINQL